jgi:hypothetical protein
MPPVELDGSKYVLPNSGGLAKGKSLGAHYPNVKQLLRILVGLALLMAVLAIFVHPTVDGPDAAHRRHASQLLIAVVALVSTLLVAPTGLGGFSPAFIGNRISAPEMLALFCVRQC